MENSEFHDQPREGSFGKALRITAGWWSLGLLWAWIAACGADEPAPKDPSDILTDSPHDWGDLGDESSITDLQSDIEDMGIEIPSDLSPETTADTTEDQTPSDLARETLIPPFVPGPPAELFDCRATGPLPERLSQVPLDCPLDTQCTERMVVAHRGAGGQFGMIAPENSLQAIRAAIVMGVDGVELDVRVTGDEHLVLMHDETVDRTTFGSGSVADMTLDEVTALHLRPPEHPSREVDGDFSCATVPTLIEALELARGRLFVDIDLKSAPIDLVIDAIHEAEVSDQTYIGSNSLERLVQAREIDPEILILARPDTAAELEATLTSFTRVPDVVELPVQRVSDLAETAHLAGCAVFTNVFPQDAEAYYSGREDIYLAIYGEGADILQTELPPLLLQALDRWPY